MASRLGLFGLFGPARFLFVYIERGANERLASSTLGHNLSLFSAVYTKFFFCSVMSFSIIYFVIPKKREKCGIVFFFLITITSSGNEIVHSARNLIIAQWELTFIECFIDYHSRFFYLFIFFVIEDSGIVRFKIDSKIERSYSNCIINNQSSSIRRDNKFSVNVIEVIRSFV